MKPNPFKLNAYEAIRNPDSMPPIMKRAIANLMLEFKTGKRANGKKSTLKDPGTDHERFLAAFNIISTSFTRNNIIKGRKRSLDLTGRGERLQNTLPSRTRKKRRAYLKKLKKMPQKARNEARAHKKLAPHKRLKILDRILSKLKSDLEDGRIEERQN